MCQELVREFLGENPNGWFTVREVWFALRYLDLTLGSVSDNCKMLRKRNQVLFHTERRLVGKSFKDVIVYKFRRLL